MNNVGQPPGNVELLQYFTMVLVGFGTIQLGIIGFFLRDHLRRQDALWAKQDECWKDMHTEINKIRDDITASALTIAVVKGIVEDRDQKSKVEKLVSDMAIVLDRAKQVRRGD